MQIAQASAPKGGSVRTAHGGLKNRQSTLSTHKKAHLAIRSLLFGVDSLNSERASLLAKAKCAHRKVVRHAKRVAVF